MLDPIRVCFWTTTFQSHTLALAHHLSQQTDFEVIIALTHPRAHREEIVWRLLDKYPSMLNQRSWRARGLLRKFRADLLIVDNHLPSYRIAPRILVLWHAFGWRRNDLSRMRKEIQSHVGDISVSNDRFTWQAFGSWDRQYRIHELETAPENVSVLGAAVSDWLLPSHSPGGGSRPAPIRTDGSRKTVLLAPTWHYGGVLGHWGDELALLDRYFQYLDEQKADVILRMHDRRRYSKGFLLEIEKLAGRRSQIHLKYQDVRPDNLIDILDSDILVSNYSSILTLFYFTGKPTIHIAPLLTKADALVLRSLKRGRLRQQTVSSPEEMWKLDLSEHGGLKAHDFDALLNQTSRALQEPDCCRDRSREFVNRYIFGADGKTCRRMADFIRSWLL